MDLNKLKKQTNAYKMHLNHSVSKLQGELDKNLHERNTDLLKQLIEQVEIKHEKWESAMMKIQEIDADVDIDQSMDEINKILDLIIELKVQSKDSLKKQSLTDIKIESDESREGINIRKVKDRMN